MTIYLAFDVYGTLIDPSGISAALQSHTGDQTADFVAAWRQTQLEYSFRRALMQDYVDFSVCTSQALDLTLQRFGVALPEDERARLLAFYRVLPPYADSVSGLEAMKRLPARCFAFSNGKPDDLHSLLQHAQIDHLFDGIVSLYDIRTFKPNPAAYAYFHRAAQTGGAETWLVSSNPFDVIGGMAAGMKAVWLRRTPDVLFDPWDIEPTKTATNMSEVAQIIAQRLAHEGE